MTQGGWRPARGAALHVLLQVYRVVCWVHANLLISGALFIVIVLLLTAGPVGAGRRLSRRLARRGAQGSQGGERPCQAI